MLSGFYGLIFGESSAADVVAQQENIEPSASSCDTKEVEDWCFVEDEATSGRSSPELVPHMEMRDVDELSFRSSKDKRDRQMTDEEIRRAEQLRAVRDANAQRLKLEQMLFADAEPSTNASSGRISKSAQLSACRLKRVAATVGGTEKAKPRSKKSGKLSSGRNNDRKVNNIA